MSIYTHIYQHILSYILLFSKQGFITYQDFKYLCLCIYLYIHTYIYIYIYIYISVEYFFLQTFLISNHLFVSYM